MGIGQWDDEDDFVKEMLDTGCMKDYFIDDDGEWICQWDMEKLENMYPDVAKAVQEAQLEEVGEVLNDLVDQGMLEMSFQETENGLEEMYSLSEKGKIYAQEMAKLYELDKPNE